MKNRTSFRSVFGETTEPTKASASTKTTTVLVMGILAVMSLLLSACSSDDNDDDGTVTMARATWDSGHMQAAIYAELIGELGYTVTDPADATLDPNAFYPALDSGQYDLWVNGWFPLHDIYLEAELVSGLSIDTDIEPVGYQVRSGALQGYLIDKATAEEYDITSMSQLADPTIAELFDHDGDGLADLYGCNEGWACYRTINTHISEHDWGESVKQISGDYSAQISEVSKRVAEGTPSLFYAWTPNWTYEVLRPGTDVVWLEADALEDEEGTTEVRGLRGCESDPCNLGWAVSSIRAVGNSDFLDDNPDIERLLEQVVIPLADVVEQNARRAEVGDDYSEADVRADAEAWIEANRPTVDGWLQLAKG